MDARCVALSAGLVGLMTPGSRPPARCRLPPCFPLRVGSRWEYLGAGEVNSVEGLDGTTLADGVCGEEAEDDGPARSANG
jgi:hypothetical protein